MNGLAEGDCVVVGLLPGFDMMRDVGDVVMTSEGARPVQAAEVVHLFAERMLQDELALRSLLKHCCRELAELGRSGGYRYAGEVEARAIRDEIPWEPPGLWERLRWFARDWWEAWAHPRPRLRRPSLRRALWPLPAEPVLVLRVSVRFA